MGKAIKVHFVMTAAAIFSTDLTLEGTIGYTPNGRCSNTTTLVPILVFTLRTKTKSQLED